MTEQDEAHKDLAIQVLEGGFQLAGELHILLAGNQVPFAIRAAAGMAIACVTTLIHAQPDASREDTKKTLQLMFDLNWDHACKLVDNRKKGMI